MPKRPQQAQAQQAAPKQTRGTVNACACPWCKKPNDFRGLDDYGLEPGNILTCDHCGRNFKIMSVQAVTVIRLAPTTARGNLYDR